MIWGEELDSTAVLDGFLIRDGNDDRSPTSAGNGLGGGLYVHGYGQTGFCRPTIRNCQFTNNMASWGAGAFNNGYAGGNAEPYYENCIFYQNHAYIEAGGMDSYGVGGNASPTVVNTIFYANTSATNVGAMYAWGGNSGGNCHPVLINCIFANNTATNGYGGAFIADAMDENGSTSSGSCTVTLQNCVLWNNSATGDGPQFYIRGNGEVLATYSDIDMTGQTGAHVISGPGTGNLNTSPMFVDIMDAMGLDGCWLTSDDGLQLQSGSPLINAGLMAGAPATDILGAARDGNIDIGAYEYQTMLNLETPAKGFQFYPNPTNGWLQLTFDAPGEHQVAVYDLMGRVYLQKQLQGSAAIDVSQLASGVYLLKVDNGSEYRFVRE